MVFVTDEKKKAYFRKLRKDECFPIINRGKAWYDLLTIEQESELKEWYEKWLNITDTYEIPTKPSWLNDKLDTEVELL